MSGVTRRGLLIASGTGALGVAALGGLALRNGLPDLIDAVIRAEFGDRVADEPDARAFIEDFAAFVREKDGPSSQAKAAFVRWAPEPLLARTDRDDAFRTWILESFIYATTAVRCFETGAPLVFVSKRYRGESGVCANTLSYSWI